MEEPKIRGITLRRVVTDEPEAEPIILTKTDAEMISAGLLYALQLAAERASDDQKDVSWSLVTRVGVLEGIVDKHGSAVVSMDPVSVDISHKLFGL